MAGSVNKVILVGNLGKDPEIRTLTSGDRVANLTIATSESWRDRTSGEKKEKTEWHRVVIFNDNLVKVAESYLKKGSSVYIEGQLSTRKWTDNSGVEKYSTEIVLQKFRGELTMLGGRGDGGGASDRGGDEGGFRVLQRHEPVEPGIGRERPDQQVSLGGDGLVGREGRLVQVLQHPRARPVRVGAVLEQHVDERVSVERIAADRRRARHREHLVGIGQTELDHRSGGDDLRHRHRGLDG